MFENRSSYPSTTVCAVAHFYDMKIKEISSSVPCLEKSETVCHVTSVVSDPSEMTKQHSEGSFSSKKGKTAKKVNKVPRSHKKSFLVQESLLDEMRKLQASLDVRKEKQIEKEEECEGGEEPIIPDGLTQAHKDSIVFEDLDYQQTITHSVKFNVGYFATSCVGLGIMFTPIPVVGLGLLLGSSIAGVAKMIKSYETDYDLKPVGINRSFDGVNIRFSWTMKTSLWYKFTRIDGLECLTEDRRADSNVECKHGTLLQRYMFENSDGVTEEKLVSAEIVTQLPILDVPTKEVGELRVTKFMMQPKTVNYDRYTSVLPDTQLFLKVKTMVAYQNMRCQGFQRGPIRAPL